MSFLLFASGVVVGARWFDVCQAIDVRAMNVEYALVVPSWLLWPFVAATRAVIYCTKVCNVDGATFASLPLLIIE